MDILQPHFNPVDLFRINKVRLSMQVLLLSVISTLDGKCILPDIEKGLSHRKSMYEWPKQPLVSKYLPLWKEACNIMCQQLDASSLGSWYQVCQQFQWHSEIDNMYLTDGNDTHLYWYNNTLYLVSSDNIQQIPIPFQKFNYDSVIGQIQLPSSTERKIVKLIRKNRLIFGSGGSENNGIGRFAWGMLDVHNLTNPLIMFQAPVHGDCDQVTALHAELFGLFACLYYMRYIITKYNINPTNIPVFSDCADAILAATQPFYISCKTVMGDDADIRAELRHVYKEVKKFAKVTHVKSHQNNTKPLSQLSPAAILNVSLDRYMKKPHIGQMLPHENMIPHLPVQKISLRNNYDRITNNYPTSLTRFSVEYEAERIESRKWKLDHEQMSSVNWRIYARMIKSYSQFRKFSIAKFVHGQWPVLSREHEWNRSTTPLCSLCNACTESIDHIFCCQETHTKANRLKQLETLDSAMTKLDTFPLLQRHLINILRKFTSGYQVIHLTVRDDNPDNECIQAVNKHISLSPRNCLRGLLTKTVVEIQQKYISLHRPKTNNVIYCGTKVTAAIHTFSTSLWKYRCDVVNNVSQTMMERHTHQQAKQLYLCLLKDPFKLPYENRKLLDKKIGFFNKTTLRNLQSWINRINLALNIQSEKSSVGIIDIRDWLKTAKPEESRIHFLNDDFSYDSDDTRNYGVHFPDEDDPSHWVI